MLKKYKIIYQEDNEIKTKIIQSENLEEETLPLSILDIKTLGFDFKFSKNIKIKEKDLKNCLYELSLMLNSSILVDEALDILIKNEKNMSLKEFLNSLKESFSNSEDINKNLEKFQINPLIKSFFKITQNTGNPSSNISALNEIICENYELKKEFKKSMTYPFVLLSSFFLSLLGIFKFVVPNFQSIFQKSPIEIPLATKILFGVKEFFEHRLYLILILGSFLIIAFIFYYKNNSKFKYFIDMILVKSLFILSDIYKSKILYAYFFSMNILLENKHDFLEAFIKSKQLIKNTYLLKRFDEIEEYLKNGKSVKEAFINSNLFDDMTINLINSGEVTNSLNTVIKEIRKILKRRFTDKLILFSQLIEPIFFLFIMSLILWIILAIFVPLWSMGDILKS